MSIYVTIEQTIPTYLEEFLHEDLKCILVHKKVKIPSKYSSDGDLENSFNTTEGEFDLTGNPLQVDLNNSVMLIQTGLQQTQPHWTVAESQHFPLNIMDARNILNSNFNNKESPLPTFCIVNGKDVEKTVMIGGQNCGKYFKTYIVRILGLYAQNDVQLSLENLRVLHEKYVRFEADTICYYFKRIYNMHGSIIHEIPNLENFHCNGSMFIQTAWNTEEQDEPGDIQMKINVRVISGHRQSHINFLFEHVKKLQYLIEISANQHDLSKTIVSTNPLTISELTNSIQNLCLSNTKIKKNRAPNIIDLTDLREETILDKLWYLLIRCHNLEDLKNTLCVFFTIVKREHFDKNDNVLDCVVKECSMIPDYLSKMTCLEALNLLLYIGFEKLKRDYFTLTYFYHPLQQAQLEQKWSEFKPLDCHTSKIITKINDNVIHKKMSFLKDLHRVSEVLIFLKRDVKNCSELSRENFDIICRKIFEKYIFNKSDHKRENGVELLEISCDLDCKNHTLYKNKIPVTSIFQYVSKVHQSEIKTVLHVSQQPIFPKNIFEDYEFATMEDDHNEKIQNQVYVSVLTELKHMF